MRPQDITITITKTVPKLICTICKEDVTELADQELQENHKIYFCSKCGKASGAVSHNREDIVKHIQENHKVDAGKDDNELPMVPAENENSNDSGIAVYSDDTSYDAEVSELKANTTENGTKEIQAKHQHSWKKEAKTEKVIMGYKTVYEDHDFCCVCGKDLNDWYVAAKKQAKEMGIENCSETPIYQETISKHIDQHIAETGLFSTRVDEVKVKKPIYKEITVISESCECGAKRTTK